MKPAINPTQRRAPASLIVANVPERGSWARRRPDGVFHRSVLISRFEGPRQGVAQQVSQGHGVAKKEPQAGAMAHSPQHEPQAASRAAGSAGPPAPPPLTRQDSFASLSLWWSLGPWGVAAPQQSQKPSSWEVDARAQVSARPVRIRC